MTVSIWVFAFLFQVAVSSSVGSCISCCIFGVALQEIITLESATQPRRVCGGLVLLQWKATICSEPNRFIFDRRPQDFARFTRHFFQSKWSFLLHVIQDSFTGYILLLIFRPQFVCVKHPLQSVFEMCVCVLGESSCCSCHPLRLVGLFSRWPAIQLKMFFDRQKICYQVNWTTGKTMPSSVNSASKDGAFRWWQQHCCSFEFGWDLSATFRLPTTLTTM